MPNLDLLFVILEKNGPDILALEQALGGVKGVLALLPHLKAIYATAKAEQQGAPHA